nr:retrovirus-related Pol polyprotein from transposon TNT 1-94 [Tanacetum cinerariifolium]
MKGLSECKASESNVRRIQVKDIVKKVEDHLKTYSSAGMDISRRPLILLDPIISGAIPPIPPPFGASSGNLGSPNANRVDTMPITTDPINTTTMTNVAQSVVDENLPQLLDSRGGDSDVEEDQRTNNEFMADLNAEYHKRVMLANQKRFYKRSGRVGSARKPIDKTKETCFACGKTGHFYESCPSNKTSTPSYPSSNNSFNKFKSYTPPINQTSSHNTSNCQKDYKGKYKGLKARMTVLTQRIDDLTKGKKDERTTRIRAFMAIAEDEPSVGKADASISQLCDANFKVLFTKTQGTIFIQNDEVDLISPRRRDVYVIDMSSFNKESNACFLAKPLQGKDDEAISQTSIKGDAINFNKNRSFHDDEFIKPMPKNSQCSINIEYFLYVFAYKNITPVVLPTLQNSVTSKSLEFTIANGPPADHEPDYVKSAEIFESAEPQDNVLIESFSNDQPAPVISPSAEKNKMDEERFVTKNKARLVAQGYNQQEGIDYEKTFAHVSRLEAIRIFLAYVAYIDFTVYQMDMKSAFLHGKSLEEVYVQQPPRFESSEFPDHVCKLDKALYGLKQAPRAWYQANPKESHLVAVKRIFRDHILKGDIELHFVPTELQLPDIFTKPLPEPSFTRLVVELATRFDFFTAIGLTDSKTVVPLSPKGSVRAGLATLGLTNKDKPSLICTELVNSSPLKVKYFSPIWKIFMQARRVFDPSPKEVNVDESIDKSPSRNNVQPLSQPKVPTAKKPKKKKIPSSTHPKEDQLKAVDTTEVPEKIIEKEEVAEEQTLEIPLLEQLLKEVDNHNQAVQTTSESPYDTESEIKVVKSFLTSHLSKLHDQTMNDFEVSADIRDNSDSDLHSMHDDELSLPNHMDHICEEVNSLHSRLADLESSIAQKFSYEIQSSLPSLLQDVKDLLESTVIINETTKGEKKQKDTNAIPVPTQGEHKTGEKNTPPKPSPETQGELAYKESTLTVFETKVNKESAMVLYESKKKDLVDLTTEQDLEDDDDLDKQPFKTTTMRITIDKDPLNLRVYPEFRLRILGFSEWLEVHALSSKKSGKSYDVLLQSLMEKFQWVLNQAKRLGLPPSPELATFGLTVEEKKRKRTEFLKEMFVTEDVRVDGMNRNLILLPKVVPIEEVVIKEPESGIFYMNRNTNVVF